MTQNTRMEPSSSAVSRPLDLNAIASIALTPHMVAHLLRGLNEPSSAGNNAANLASHQQPDAPIEPANDDDDEFDMVDQAEGSLEDASESRDERLTPSPTASTSTDIQSPLATAASTNIYSKTKQSNQGIAIEVEEPDQQKEPAHGVSRKTCEYCGRSFKRASDTRRHERIHTNTRPHVCEICGFGFVQKSALTTHLRTHTGEKPYECRVGTCDRMFSDASSRKKHERTHDSVEENRYPCPVCPSQVFRRSDTLSVHVKRSHPELLPANKAARNMTWKQSQAEPATAWKMHSAQPYNGSGPSSANSLSSDFVQNGTLTASCPPSEVQSVFFSSGPPSAASSYTTFASSSSSGTGSGQGPTTGLQLHYNQHTPFEPIIKSDGASRDKSRSLAPLPSSEELFAFLNTESTPKGLPGPFLNNRSGGLPARQPLARVPSFGSPYVSTPPVPAKSNSQLFRELSDLFK